MEICLIIYYACNRSINGWHCQFTNPTSSYNAFIVYSPGDQFSKKTKPIILRVPLSPNNISETMNLQNYLIVWIKYFKYTPKQASPFIIST